MLATKHPSFDHTNCMALNMISHRHRPNSASRLRTSLLVAAIVAISGQAPMLANAQDAARQDTLQRSSPQGDAPALAQAQSDPAQQDAGMPPLGEQQQAPVDGRPLWPAIPGSRTITLGLKELGAWSSLKLSGTASNQFLYFNVRPDERVVGARLVLGYDYSPALLSDLSHLAVALNGENAALVSFPQQGSNLGNLRAIPLDPSLFKPRNELQLGFFGHYTRYCENPMHSSLWMTVSEQTYLELDLQASQPGITDLSNAHLLFTEEPGDGKRSIPVLFGSQAGFATFKAAGIVASWLGAQTKSRKLEFHALTGQFPPSNAIVLLKAGESVGGITGTPQTSVTILPNPVNPDARLLVLSGADDNALQRAARALALTQRSLSGSQIIISNEVLPEARVPYDAPAWLPVNRPVKFGEIASAQELNVSGHFPGVIRLNFRVPPDLYTWRSQGVPVNLKYRASVLPSQLNSALNVSLNRHMLQSIALQDGLITNADGMTSTTNARLPSGMDAPSAGNTTQPSSRLDGTALRGSQFHIPAYASNGRDQMQMAFSFDVQRRGICQDLATDNMIAAIDSESTLDFSGFPHYAPLPDLQSFVTLGFPFTRLADLGETAVVMPDKPSADELDLYLSLMSMMGEATGYPVLRHEIVSASAVDSVKDRDLLVLGSATSQPLLTSWAEHLPIADINGERRLREVVRSWRPRFVWETREIDPLPAQPASMNLSAAGKIAVMMGLESPLQNGRSAVFLYADQPNDLERVMSLLANEERWPQVQGDIAVVGPQVVESAKVTPTYYIGSLPVENKLRWFFRDRPLIVALLGLLAIVLLSAAGYRLLRMRRKR